MACSGAASLPAQEQAEREGILAETIIRYANCKVLRSNVHGKGELVEGDVWVRGGKILDPMKLFFQEKKSATITYDCQGLIASPGFIDLQINGAVGYDFSSFSSLSQLEEGFSKVSKLLLQHGVTGYCPTVVTSSRDYYKKFLPLMKRRKGGRHGAAILGIHAEGPFINSKKKGAHKATHVQEELLSEDEMMSTYTSLDNISIVTLAPELSGSNKVIPWLVEKGIVVSLGHSLATLEIAENAVNKGASLITHLFNAMLPFHHRDPGIVGLITNLNLNKQIYYGLIGDGHHTHETVQRIANNANPKGVVLVTDALPLLCYELDGTDLFQLGETRIQRKGSKACVVGTNDLAGGITSMSECVAQFHHATDCEIPDALEAASLHPARVLNLEHKGSLDFGADADIVFLTFPLTREKREKEGVSGGFEVIATVIGGEIVYGQLRKKNEH